MMLGNTVYIIRWNVIIPDKFDKATFNTIRIGLKVSYVHHINVAIAFGLVLMTGYMEQMNT